MYPDDVLSAVRPVSYQIYETNLLSATLSGGTLRAWIVKHTANTVRRFVDGLISATPQSNLPETGRSTLANSPTCSPMMLRYCSENALRTNGEMRVVA
jgi:hypothetical protein